MSLSKHALTYLKRHYRALYQRAYALGLASSLMRWVDLIPAAPTAQKTAPARRHVHPALPLLIALTTLTCGPGLETSHAAPLSGTIISGNYNQAVYINQEGTYTVADGTTFKNVSDPANSPISMIKTDGSTDGQFGLIFEGSALFESNSAATAVAGGGAIAAYGSLNFSGGPGDITFSGNTATNTSSSMGTEGGAIYTYKTLTMTGSTGKISFSGNQAQKGGAINSSSVNLTAGSGDIEFVNNHASDLGGAIYINQTGSANVNIRAAEGDIVFSGNTAGSTRNAIYIDNSDTPSINLQAKGNHFISFEDAISGRDPKYINVRLNDGTTDYDGTIKFSTSMTLGLMTQYNGTFELSGLDTTLTSNYLLHQGTYVVKEGATGNHETFNQQNGELNVGGTLIATTFLHINGTINAEGTLDVDTFYQSNGTINAEGILNTTTFNHVNGELNVGGTLTATTFNYSDGSFKLDGKLDVGTFNQNGGDLKAGGTEGEDNLVLGTDGSMEVDDYQLKNGSLTIGEGADKLTIGNLTLNTDTTLTVEENATLTVSNSLTNSGSLILKPQSTFILQNGDYTTPATEHNFSAGTTFEISGKYTLSQGATIKVSGLSSKIQAKTIALNPGSTLHFSIDDSAKGSTATNAMLNLIQTDASATAIPLKDVTITVDSATAVAAKQRAARTGTVETVYLLSSNKGFTIDKPTSNVNELYKVTVQGTDTEVYRYGEEKAPDPDPSTDPDPGQGGTDPSTGDGGQTDPQPGTGEGGSNPGTGEGGSQGGGSLIAVRDPQALEHMGATGNQAHAFSIFENGTFAEGSPEARFFKAKGGIFEVTQQDGIAGLTALTALLPNDAPVVLDQARNTMSFITQAAFDGAGLPPGRSGRAQVSLSAQNQGASPIAGANSVASLSTASTGRSAVQDEGGRISAPLSLNSALWLKARLNSIDSERYENGSAGYDGDLSLLALGIDTALTSEWSLGLGFSYSKGDLDGLSRSVESEGYTLFGYSRYHSGNWYLNGLVAVSLEDYEEDSQVLSHSLTSDYRATTLYGGIFTGLELSTAQGGTFTPELGLTVLSTKLSDYDSELSDNIEAKRATISSALAGFKWQLTALSTESAELNVKGALHARYDLSTEGLDYDVGLSNGTHLQLVGEEPDRFALMPSLGVNLKLGPSRAFELEARYSAELSEHFTGQAVSLGLNYRF